MRKHEVLPGDLVVASLGEDLPRACLLPQLEAPALVKADCIRVRLGDQVLPRFVLYALQAPAAKRWANERLKGVGRQRLGMAGIRALPLTLPPLDEQLRIVALLEEHLSRLTAAGAYVEAADRRLATLRAASLTAAGSTAQAVPLADLLAEPLRNGHSAPASPTGRVRTLTLTAVTTGSFVDQHTKLTAAPEAKVERLWLVPGDILVQRSNTPELVGTIALYDGPTNWAIFPDLLIRVRVDRTRVEPEYLAAVLASPPARGRFRALAKGLAGSMPKIDQAAIAGTPVPLPCLEQQRTIAGTLRSASLAQTRLKADTKRTRTQTDVLRRALLTAAFSGRL